MLFSSPRFFVFLAFTLALLSLRMPLRAKKFVLGALSCLFYAAWDYRYLGLLLLLSAIEYACAARIVRTEDARTRKAWLLLSIVSNLGILGYFKYYNFFVTNWNSLLGTLLPLPAMQILLPAGISFYTFKSMSYTIDVYRREIPPCRSQLDYTTFITFFPELIAGPIVRASVFLPQMDRDVGPTRERLRVGASLFLLGLFKKIVIADRMAEFADAVFAQPELFDATSIACGVIAYTIQIYADFSGYSDMAIGTAKAIGYDLPENFAMPYVSTSITEFWRRWHITLSQWLRDYLYIPLGGNRHGARRTYFNLAMTMLLGGLWHGASWNFVLWGALHGAGLAAHRFLRERIGHEQRRLPPPLAWALTMLFVMLCWIPFRAPTFATTVTLLTRLAHPERPGFHQVPSALLWVVPLVVVAHRVGLRVLERARVDGAAAPALVALDLAVVRDPISGPAVALGMRTPSGAFLTVTLVLLVGLYAVFSANPFIYFQF
jgi:alginate O-acetyltransferase complex protein AlgI